jgi:hypothetical protein
MASVRQLYLLLAVQYQFENPIAYHYMMYSGMQNIKIAKYKL